MIIISHRGNLVGPSKEYENKPNQIDLAIDYGFCVEVDLHIVNNNFWLGHDEPTYKIAREFLTSRANDILVHAKTIETANFLATEGTGINWFYHTTEDLVLTSYGWLWCYPGIYVPNGITVAIDYKGESLPQVLGICTDYPVLANRRNSGV